MTQTACQYAIVRFAPFAETGEFANVGIVLLAADAGYLGFELETRRHARITKFFDGVDARHYKAAVAALEAELARARDMLLAKGFGHRMEPAGRPLAQDVFGEITRTRESIIRFSEPRVVLAEQPQAKLHDLFAHYVRRDFITRQYQKNLESSIRTWLRQANLQQRFTEAAVGDDTYAIKFPFVEMKRNDPVKVIKPLHLDQDDSTRIIDQAGFWASRIHTLRQRNKLPRHVMFAVGGPEQGADNVRVEAFHDALQRLEGACIDVAQADDRDRVVAFAAAS